MDGATFGQLNEMEDAEASGGHLAPNSCHMGRPHKQNYTESPGSSHA